MKTDDGGPVYPRPAHLLAVGNGEIALVPENAGMSLRDYFAAAALPALIADAMVQNRSATTAFGTVEFLEMAEKSYVVADRMIEARKR